MSNAFGDTTPFDALPCLVIRLDEQADIRFVNRFGLDLLGYERPDQLVGRPFQSLLPNGEEKSVALLNIVRNFMHQEYPAPVDSGVLRSDGSRIPLSWNLGYQRDEVAHGAPLVLVGFDARVAGKDGDAAALFQTVSDNYSGSIVITGPDKRILYANPALFQMTGYSPEELIGQTPAVFKSGQTAEEVYRRLWETVEAGEIWKGEFINRRKDGEQYLETKTIAAIRDVQGRLQYYFAIGEDTSQRLRYQQRIESLLVFDQLTGLPNRAAFLHGLVGVLDSARQDAREVTVLHIDIDDFFVVNEAIGASEADRLIIEMAVRIKDALRHADQLARIGTDKFAVLLGPHAHGIDSDIRDVAARILAAIRKPLSLAGKPVHATASLGIASYPADGDHADDLLAHAVNATERVKAAGGNNFRHFDAATAGGASGRRGMLRGLRQAIDNNEMVLHFQPQVSLFSGAITGLEALIRWNHPQRGLVLPGQFIPLVEQSSQIIDIGEWLLVECCRQMRAWLDAGLPPVKVAINLAARHFLVPGLHTTIADALALQNIDRHCFEIEITEGAMMQDVAAAIRSTNLLKEVGVRISLDDFGTGYSSLAYLSRFPIDVVKIDQSFVLDITSNPVNAAIAQATIAMSHKLGKIVLAEGVETEEQMQYLRRNECDEIQGYFFSKPLPAEEIAHLLQKRVTMNFAGQQAGTRGTVLFVDDEVNILASIKRALRREGYEMLMATSAAEGFSLLAKNRVQVVVSDQRMPDMNGTEFLARVKSMYPETVRMVLSGYSEISAVTDSINKGAVYRFMLKPWNDEQLKEEVFGALRHWRTLFGPKDGSGDCGEN